ncbi:cytoskeletal-regulatory complex EF hand-domain-containing protein [Mycena floridula]|nr:cytoskeletal-regulatory complex EF hand-domain-containing protein [Mycena floridula]
MSFSVQERSLVEAILVEGNSEQHEALGADIAVRIFAGSELDEHILADIWDIADEDRKGYLILREIAITVRLIGWAQRGIELTPELVDEEGPLAIITNLAVRSTSSTSSLSFQFRTLTSANKAKYQSVFQQAGPKSGILSAQQVWQIFIKSQIRGDILLQIWDLADITKRGDLDAAEFTVAMYFIHGMIEECFATIPATVPPWLAEQAGLSSKASGSQSHLNRAFSADFWCVQTSIDLTGVAVPKIVKSIADRYFTLLDQGNLNSIAGDAAVSFMNLSKLPLKELGRIWDIADASRTGSLDRTAFADMLFLIYKRLAGIEIPVSSPTLAIPPPAFDEPRITSPTSAKSIPTARDETHQLVDHLVQENRRLRTQSVAIPDVSTQLLSELGELRSMIQTLNQENSLLRAQPVPSSSRRPHKRKSQNSSKRWANEDLTDNAIFDELFTELQQKEETISQLRDTIDEAADVARHNEILRSEIDNMQQELQAAETIRNMLALETEELQRQVQELRNANSELPSTGGDEELQTLINQELSRENTTLRTKVQELQASLQQSQTARVEQEARQQEASGRRRQLQRRIQELETQRETSEADLHQRIQALERENQALRQPSRDDVLVPPPAYAEMA